MRHPLLSRIRYITTPGSSLVYLPSATQQNSNSNLYMSWRVLILILVIRLIDPTLNFPSRHSHCMRFVRVGRIQKQERELCKRMTWRIMEENPAGPEMPLWGPHQFGSIKPAAKLEISKACRRSRHVTAISSNSGLSGKSLFLEKA